MAEPNAATLEPAHEHGDWLPDAWETWPMGNGVGHEFEDTHVTRYRCGRCLEHTREVPRGT